MKISWFFATFWEKMNNLRSKNEKNQGRDQTMNFHLIWGKNLSKSSQKALDLTNFKILVLRSNVFLLAPVLREK